MQTGVQNGNFIKAMRKYLITTLLFTVLYLSLYAQDNNADFRSQLYFVPDKGLYVTAGSSYILLDSTCSQTNIFNWPNGLCPDNVICNYDGDIYLKSGKRILEYWENELSVIAELEKENFRIFPALEGRMYISSQKRDSSFLYAFDADLHSAEPIASTHDNINAVAGDAATTTVFAVGKDIFIITEGRLDLIYSDFAEINAIALTADGIFFATDYTIGIVINSYLCIPIIEDGAIDLLVADDCLYALLADGNVIKI